jgi:hypothetical protein
VGNAARGSSNRLVPALAPSGEAARSVRGGRPSFLKKRSKKLLVILAAAVPGKIERQFVKVFWFFFSKKNRFLVLRRPAAG